jgi:transposase
MGKVHPHPPYPAEFRRECLRLLQSGERGVAELSGELGVSDQTLRNWLAQAAADEGRGPGLTSDERSELRRLRAEVKVLRAEREILKKAAAFFARESEGR